MMIMLPEWVTELRDRLDEVIKGVAIKNHIDLTAIEDSKSIEDGKHSISHAMTRIYWNYGVEDRKRMEEAEEEMKTWEKKKGSSKTSKKKNR